MSTLTDLGQFGAACPHLYCVSQALQDEGFGADARSRVAHAAMPATTLAGVVDLLGRANPWAWLADDHPTRVNLILEQLGRPERIAP